MLQSPNCELSNESSVSAPIANLGCRCGMTLPVLRVQALYQEPHQGKEDVRSYFQMIVRTIPRDLKFHVDAITANDPRNVGVKWCVQSQHSAAYDIISKCTPVLFANMKAILQVPASSG